MSTDVLSPKSGGKSISPITSKSIQDSIMSFKAPKSKIKWQELPPQPNLACIEQPPLAALRLIQMIEDAERRSVLAAMVKQVIDNLDRYGVSFGIELSHLLQQHNRLLIKYEAELARMNQFIECNRSFFVIDSESATTAGGSSSAGKFFSIFDDVDNEEMEAAEEGEGKEEYQESEDDADWPDPEKPPAKKKEAVEVPSNSTTSYNTFQSEARKSLRHVPVVKDTSVNQGVNIEDVESVEDYNQSARSMLVDCQLDNVGSDNLALKPLRISDDMSVGLENISRRSNSKQFIGNVNVKDSVVKEAIFHEVVKNMCSVVGEVVISFKNILKKFFLDPPTYELVRRNIPPCTKESEFVGLMSRLNDLFTYRLLTTPEQQQERVAYMEDITHREKVNRKILSSLTKRLNQLCNFHADKKFADKTILLEQLLLDIRQTGQFSDESIRRSMAEQEKRRTMELKKHDGSLAEYKREINELNVITTNNVIRNKDVENDLRNEKYKLENELDAVIKRYDEDMVQKTEIYEVIEMQYKEEKVVLAELEEYFSELEAEYNAIMEERRQAKRTVQVMRRTFRGTSVAIKLIQSFYRSYVVRKAIFQDAKRRAKEAKKKAKTGK